MSKRPALGKGLSALIGDDKAREGRAAALAARPAWEDLGRAVRDVPLGRIVPNRFQARKIFDADSLGSLADSIRRAGIIQPLVVRPLKDGSGRFELITGERRFRAAGKAGLKTVPVIVLEANDEELSVLSLIENIQREDLNPIDEAEGLRSLIDNFGLTQEEVARRIGMSRSAVANALRLLALPGPVKDALAAGKISAGHARALLSLGDAEAMIAACARVIAESLSVRQAERMAARSAKARKAGGAGASPPDPDLEAHLRALSERLGTKVTLSGGGDKGKVEVHYFSREDRNRLLDLLYGR